MSTTRKVTKPTRPPILCSMCRTPFVPKYEGGYCPDCQKQYVANRIREARKALRYCLKHGIDYDPTPSVETIDLLDNDGVLITVNKSDYLAAKAVQGAL